MRGTHPAARSVKIQDTTPSGAPVGCSRYPADYREALRGPLATGSAALLHFSKCSEHGQGAEKPIRHGASTRQVVPRNRVVRPCGCGRRGCRRRGCGRRAKRHGNGRADHDVARGQPDRYSINAGVSRLGVRYGIGCGGRPGNVLVGQTPLIR